MANEVYTRKIQSDKRALFEETLKQEPSIERIFGKSWIKEHIFDYYDDRTIIHPLFWFILKDKNFARKLDVLKKSYDRFESLINTLKNDIVNIDSIMSNLDVYYEYKLKHPKATVIFQPEVPDSSKECDILVIINNVEYWGEVLEINRDQEKRKQDEINDYIRIQYNEKNKTNNCINLHYHRSLNKEIADKLIDFLLKESKSLTLSKGEEVSKKFILDKNLVCEVKFFGKGDKLEKGYWGGAMFPAQFMNDSMRIKNKLLDKLDKFQFPKREDVRRFFVLILKWGVETIDACDALFGQGCVIFGSDSHDLKGSRNPNGIIHDPERAKILTKLDFIVINENGKKSYQINERSLLGLEFIKTNF